MCARQCLLDISASPTCSTGFPTPTHASFLLLPILSTCPHVQIGKGYRIAHLLERDGEPNTLDKPLPKYEEVLLQNLKHDLRDVELVKVGRAWEV